MNISIDDKLFITQESLRNIKQLSNMIHYVKNDGFFTKEAIATHIENAELDRYGSLIQISVFSKEDDNNFYIHDGHHRVFAIYRGKRYYIREDEYNIRDWGTFDKYLEINLEKGWCTPFHPYYEVRQADFHEFKEKVAQLAKKSTKQAIQYITKHKNLYSKVREDDNFTVQSFIKWLP